MNENNQSAPEYFLRPYFEQLESPVPPYYICTLSWND